MVKASFSRITFMLACSVLLGTPAFAEGPGRGTSVDDWKGLTILKGGKGYVSAPMGQLHYRDIGPRDQMPMILLHQSPMSMIQFGAVQNELAKLGVRSITVDSPGFGLSDLPDKQPTIADYADNMVALLDELKLKKVIIGGHHTGAQIATSFAARHPDRVAAVVLHGAAMWRPEWIEPVRARIGKGTGTGRLPKVDGSNFARKWPVTENDRQELKDAYAWLTITSYMSGPDIGHWAAFYYDSKPDIMNIKAPTLLLSDTGDEVNPMDKDVMKLRPDFKYVEFSNGNFMEFMADPQKWAKIVADWRAETVKE